MVQTWTELRRLRIDAGLTREALGEQAGLTGQYIYRLETGRRLGSPSALKAIADVLGTTASYLDATRPRRSKWEVRHQENELAS